MVEALGCDIGAVERVAGALEAVKEGEGGWVRVGAGVEDEVVGEGRFAGFSEEGEEGVDEFVGCGPVELEESVWGGC